jgi:hypothetical protein
MMVDNVVVGTILSSTKSGPYAHAGPVEFVHRSQESTEIAEWPVQF